MDFFTRRWKGWGFWRKERGWRVVGPRSRRRSPVVAGARKVLPLKGEAVPDLIGGRRGKWRRGGETSPSVGFADTSPSGGRI